MLQLTKFYEQCYLDFFKTKSDLSHLSNDLEKIKIHAQKLFSEIDEKRFLKSKNNLLYYIDHVTWTTKREHIDDPGFRVELKKEIIHGLHLKNKYFGTYGKTIELLKPLVESINQTENRPARVLEIGSGVGKLTMAIYEQFQKSTMTVEMTGSDIVPEYVDVANLEAKEKKYNINFKIIDAFHLDQLEENSYDIVFTLHSMHHFNPAQLAVIMAGAHKIASKAFIGIDAYRGICNFLFIFFSGAVKSFFSFNSIFFHDAFISARKMYSAKQLEILARVGCSQGSIVAENLKPGLTVIKISS